MKRLSSWVEGTMFESKWKTKEKRRESELIYYMRPCIFLLFGCIYAHLSNATQMCRTENHYVARCECYDKSDLHIGSQNFIQEYYVVFLFKEWLSDYLNTVFFMCPQLSDYIWTLSYIYLWQVIWRPINVSHLSLNLKRLEISP